MSLSIKHTNTQTNTQTNTHTQTNTQTNKQKLMAETDLALIVWSLMCMICLITQRFECMAVYVVSFRSFKLQKIVESCV